MKIFLDSMGGGAWPFLVGGVICLVNSVNEQDIDELVAFKNKEINAVQDSIESKMVRSGEIAVQHAEQLNDLDDTTELAESKKFFADLDMNCANKRKELVLYPFSFRGCPNAFSPNWEKEETRVPFHDDRVCISTMVVDGRCP